MLATTQGILGESIFITECIKRGIEILQPVVDMHGYDFVINHNGFKKIQVKTCRRADNRYADSTSYKFSVCRGASGRCYDNGDYDYLAAYIMPVDCWYIIPFSCVKSKTIRINIESKKCKYINYRNAFDLLKGEVLPPPREIEA